MKLIFIHGRGQQGQDEIALKARWEASFDTGLENVGLTRPPNLQIAFPFYGNLLHTLELREKAKATDVILRGEPIDDDFEELRFQLEIGKEIAKIAGVDIVKDVPIDSSTLERGMLNAKWVLNFLRVLDTKTGAGAFSIKQFTHDVYVYLTDSMVSTAIDALVRAEIKSEGPVVVVAHSLGSIVAYNVLCKFSSLHSVKLITIGSPLGIKGIRTRLETPIKHPECLKKNWFNARDEKDYVALYPLTEQHFDIKPAVEDYSGVKNFVNNNHGMEGYLEDPTVAKRIYDSIK
jgi:hypothetical protein